MMKRVINDLLSVFRFGGFEVAEPVRVPVGWASPSKMSVHPRYLLGIGKGAI